MDGLPDPTTGMPSFPEYRKEVTAAADQKAASGQQLVAAADTAGQQQIDRAQQFAGSQQPFQQDAPTDQINSVMAGAPFLFALSALGGKATKVNGLAMLGALNGMSDGIIKGDEEALDQNWKRYNASFDKWKVNADQQFRIYQELAQAYGSASDGKLRALTAAMNMTNDAASMKLQVDDPKQYWDMKLKMEEQNLKLQEWAQTRKLREKQIENIDSEIKTRGAKVGQAETKRKQSITSAVTQIDTLIKELDKTPSVAGARGMVSRGIEFGKSAIGMDSPLPAHKFQSDMEALLLQVPKLLTGSSRSAKDERDRVSAIADGLKLGVTAGIAKEKLRALKDILTEAALDPEQVAREEESASSSSSSDQVGPFDDAEKEARYQAWKKAHAK